MKALETTCGAVAALVAPAPAWAGAWLAEGGGQGIITTTVGEADEDEFYETSLYWERALGDRTAIVATPWYRSGADSGEEGWRGEAVVGVKTELAHSDRGAMSLQGGVLWRSETQQGCGEGGAELRWMGGLSFGEGGRGFVNVEAAARVQGGGCAGERVDVAAGYRPSERWLAMAQVFTDDARYDEEAIHGQLSLVRFGEGARFGLQLGVRARFDGDDREPALVLGLWGRPRG